MTLFISFKLGREQFNLTSEMCPVWSLCSSEIISIIIRNYYLFFNTAPLSELNGMKKMIITIVTLMRRSIIELSIHPTTCIQLGNPVIFISSCSHLFSQLCSQLRLNYYLYNCYAKSIRYFYYLNSSFFLGHNRTYDWWNNEYKSKS